MTSTSAVRAFAGLDVAVTGLLALPWVADGVLALMVTWFGLDGSPGDVSFSPLTIALANVAGVLGVLWNGRRLLAPTPELVRWDLAGRVVVAGVLAVAVLRGAPEVLLVFVATELAGAVAAAVHLRSRR